MALLKLILVFAAASSVGTSPVASRKKTATIPKETSQEELTLLSKRNGAPPRKSQTPPFILDIYRKLEHEDVEGRGRERNGNEAKTLRFFHAQSLENQEYHFNISSVSPHTIVRAAEIYLFTPKPGAVSAYDVTSGQALSSQALPLGRSGWTGFDITILFRDWLEKPQRSWGIQLVGEEVLDTRLSPWLILYTDYEGHVNNLAGLRGMSQRKPVKRRHRRYNSIDVTDDPDLSHSCRRSRMFVNFTEIGMGTFIIAPEGYNAFRCNGACAHPISRRRDPTNHAIIQSLARMTQEGLNEPCCVPVSLSPISVLYLDDEMNIVYKKFNEMAVQKCGCR